MGLWVSLGGWVLWTLFAWRIFEVELRRVHAALENERKHNARLFQAGMEWKARVEELQAELNALRGDTFEAVAEKPFRCAQIY